MKRSEGVEREQKRMGLALIEMRLVLALHPGPLELFDHEFDGFNAAWQVIEHFFIGESQDVHAFAPEDVLTDQVAFHLLG